MTSCECCGRAIAVDDIVYVSMRSGSCCSPLCQDAIKKGITRDEAMRQLRVEYAAQGVDLDRRGVPR